MNTILATHKIEKFIALVVVMLFGALGLNDISNDLVDSPDPQICINQETIDLAIAENDQLEQTFNEDMIIYNAELIIYQRALDAYNAGLLAYIEASETYVDLDAYNTAVADYEVLVAQYDLDQANYDLIAQYIEDGVLDENDEAYVLPELPVAPVAIEQFDGVVPEAPVMPELVIIEVPDCEVEVVDETPAE